MAIPGVSATMSAKDETVRRIEGVIRSLDEPPPGLSGPVTADTGIANDLELDSIATMDFIMAVETEFDAVIPIEKMAEIRTVGDLADALLATHPANA